jgi:tetratricopeptide (TPR) repeat protein
MSRESEKAMKAVHQFLKESGAEDMPLDEVNALLQKFMTEYNGNQPGRVTEKTAKTADDYLELAEEATTKAKAEQYIKKALEVEPDNLDAISASLDLTENGTWEYYRKLSEAVENGTKLMEKKGLMDEDSIGDFWGILETRPYMRLLHRYADFMAEAGMMTLAARQYEEMIRLCKNDNLGVRFSLMHIYAYLEQEEPALVLHKKYDGHEETQMLLPLSVLYFKRGDFDKAEDYLKRLCAANKDTKKFFRAIKRDKLDHYVEEISGYGYTPFTIQELIVELMENSFLFRMVPLYMEWAYEKTRNM